MNTININPAELQYSWTAEVRLNNDLLITIWWTAWHSSNKSIKEIISISSDYPRYKINKSI